MSEDIEEEKLLIDRKNAFLKEYKELVFKYKVCVSSCGCCDGPWVVYDKDGALEDHIQHLEEEVNSQEG